MKGTQKIDINQKKCNMENNHNDPSFFPAMTIYTDLQPHEPRVDMTSELVRFSSVASWHETKWQASKQSYNKMSQIPACFSPVRKLQEFIPGKFL